MVDFKDVVETLSKVIKAEYILDNAFILSYLLVSSLASILLLYFAISIGQLFSNRRGLMAFIAYFALMILFSVATTYLNLKVFGFESTSEVLPYKEHVYLYVIIVEEFVEMLICYLGTHFIIKNKLNIQ